MSKLIIVSNRLPINIKRNDTQISIKSSSGGLATGLGSFYKNYKSIWIGWPGISTEEIDKKTENIIRKKLHGEKCYPVFFSDFDFKNYYYGFCNKTIWPLFHYFPINTTFDKKYFESYKKINRLFCDEILKKVKEHDKVWIHDYHLMLLPQMLREKIPNLTIGFFLHIPFPSSEVFRLLPWRDEILWGLLGANLVGLHTWNYVKHFLNSSRFIFGVNENLGQISFPDHVLKVDAFPMGINYSKFANAASSAPVKKERKKIRGKIGDRKLILSLDRLDYTKGIAQRLEAFDLFLETYPEYKDKVTLIVVAVPSRTGIENYKHLKQQLDQLVGNINGKYGNIGWTPIWYLYRSIPFYQLVALYSIADVALVTPLRDGMNLVAKEFIATKLNGKGVLILSETAGAVKELGEALIINPNNKDQIADAIKEAICIDDDDQIERNVIMQKRLLRYNVTRWAKDFMDKLELTKKIECEVKAKYLSPKLTEDLIGFFHEKQKRLLFFDYDGTLVSFKMRPDLAKPDDELLNMLNNLSRNPLNNVVIISGRDKDILTKWLGHLNLDMVAEHGAWIKQKNSDWEVIEPLTSNWKVHIRPILEFYVDRTPGALIEEKTFSLVWHYRKVDHELGPVRACELKEALLHLTINKNLSILEGNKVLEIKKSEINKGNAAKHWLENDNWDFIFAIGDDWTDEDLFKVMPQDAFTVKVGMTASIAKLNVKSVDAVRKLIKKMIG